MLKSYSGPDECRGVLADAVTQALPPPSLLLPSERVNFDHYCQQKAAPAGSAVYYAVRQAAAADRPRLTALFAYRRELEETIETCSDVAVGQAKLAWWQREIQSLASVDGTPPTHPVTRALAAYLPDPRAELAALQAVAEGYAMDLDQARYLDYAGLNQYLLRVGGQGALLVARAAGMRSSAALEAAAQLGHALALAQLLRDVGQHARHGRIYLPVDELQRFGVTAADIINRRYGDAFAALMTFQVMRARAAIVAALAALRTDPHTRRAARATLGVQAAIALATLAEIEAERYEVLHQQIFLTPLRMLWLAWRGAR
jgi:15-cis-phytoene synthase